MNINKIIQKIKSEKIILLVLTIFLISNAYIFIKNPLILWDQSVYIGIGKWIFSKSTIGLWETIRPLTLPIILGAIWKTGLPMIKTSTLLILTISTLTLYTTYKISKKLYNQKTAITASITLAITPLFYHYSTEIMTGIPSTLIALTCIYTTIKEKYKLSAFLAAIAFLTRFPQGLILSSILLFTLLYKKHKIKKITEISTIFIITIIPFLIFNQVTYSNPLYTFIEASKHASNPFHSHNFWYSLIYYPIQIIKNNPLYLFIIPGTIYTIKEKNENTKLLIITSIIYLTYFTIITNQQLRFSLTFLPYLAILTGYGIYKTTQTQKILKTIPIAIIAFLIITANLASISQKTKTEDKIQTPEYINKIKKSNAKTILTSDPIPTAFTNKKFLTYYRSSYTLLKDYNKYKNKADIIIHLPQSFYCLENDKKCKQKKKKGLQKIKSENKLIFNKSYNSQTYLIFKNN